MKTQDVMGLLIDLGADYEILKVTPTVEFLAERYAALRTERDDLIQGRKGFMAALYREQDLTKKMIGERDEALANLQHPGPCAICNEMSAVVEGLRVAVARMMDWLVEQGVPDDGTPHDSSHNTDELWTMLGVVVAQRDKWKKLYEGALIKD